MSKKRAKSGAGSAGVSRWESGLLSTPFEEDNWKGCISFVIGNQLDDKEYANILSSAVDSKLRKLFSVIYRQSLLEEVVELGNSKAKKPKDVAPFSEICETVKSEYLDKGDEIPMGLMAKLLKWKLLAIKDKDIKRREEEKKASENRDSAKGKGKGKDAGGGGKRARSKSPAKGAKGKKSPEVPSPKKDSKLKKRGEEDDDNKYIDDEPDDGPQHYVIIEGFDQAPLLSFLTDLGIHINCIIRLQSEDYSLFDERRREEEEERDEDERPPEVIEEEKKAKKKAEASLEKFWLQHEPLLKNATKGSKLQDIARLKYTVKNHIVPDDMKDNEKRTQFGTDMFEEVACMMYDLLDSERQYRNFLDNMKLIQIPLVQKDGGDGQSVATLGAPAVTQPPAAGQPGLGTDQAGAVPELKPLVVSADVDTRYYTELMDSVPQESVSVPLIMHCMLEQVVATSEERGPPSDSNKIPREDGLEHSLSAHIDKMAGKLHINAKENNETQPPLNGISVTKPSVPEFFHHGDDISLRLRHLTTSPLVGFRALEAELAMLDYIPVAKLREFPRPPPGVVKQRAARLQELLHHCSDEGGVNDQAEVDHAFKQFVFESLALSGTKGEEGCVAPRPVTEGIVWDDPYPLFAGKREQDAEGLEDGVGVGMEKEGGGEEKLTAENVKKAEEEMEGVQEDAQILPPSTGILKAEGRKSRQGSASSQRSAKSSGLSRVKEQDTSRPPSAVHFEKDASGHPIIPPKVPAPPVDPTSAAAGGTNQAGQAASPVKPGSRGGEDLIRPSSSRSNISVHDVVGDRQLRNLDDWCYAEHFEPHVLIQVLEGAREMYPFMDTYYHRRDHTLLVVMHNPAGPNLQNTQPWDAKLHSDVGFRNYMEHVAENVAQWAAVEEAEYQAELQEKELLRQRELALSRASSPAPSRATSSKKGRRTQSPKARSKSPKGRRSVSPAQTVDNLDPNSKEFMRPNSMKAWKVEQDKIREEEEKKRADKDKKGRKSARSRSSSPKKGDSDDKKDKKPGTPSKDGSRQSSRKGDKDKDKKGQEGGTETQEAPPPETPREPERVYPFVGYDVGNNLIQASGNTTTLFPCDGGQIRTEQTQFINGTKFIKTSVLKDGHVFVVHILDPRDKEEVEGEGEEEEKEKKTPPQESKEEGMTEKAEEEVQEKDQKEGEETKKKKRKDKPLSSFGSFSATLNDGMVLSFSNYGTDGKTKKAAEKQEIEVLVPLQLSPTPTTTAPSPKAVRGGSGKKGKKNQQQQQQQQAEAEKQAQLQAEQQQREEEERRKREAEAEAEEAEPEIPPFQQLFVSCPDGLHVSYLQEPNEGEDAPRDPNVPGRLLIRQRYLTQTCSSQPCEAPRQNPAMQELSRLLTSEGSVIKLMKDGSTQVLFADGAVSCSPSSPSSGPYSSSPTPRDQSPQRGGSALSQRSESPSKKSTSKGKGGDTLELDVPLPDTPGQQEWVTTTPGGQRIGTRPDGTSFEPKECLLYSATDPVTREVLTTREDRVITVERPSGMCIVDHNDGTRITTYYKKVLYSQQEEEANETGEGPFTSVRDVKHVKVECVGYATVIYNCEDSVATTIFGNGSEIVAIPDGSFEILHCEGSRLTVGVDGSARYTPKEGENGEPGTFGAYSMQHKDRVTVETCDSSGNLFQVKWNGDIYSSIAPSKEGKEEEAEEIEEGVKKESSQMMPIPRFFVIHPDGSGTEMLRQQEVLPYVQNEGLDPSVAVLDHAIPEHPDIRGISVMRPHSTNISQRWLAQLEETNIIPRNLRSRDFAKLPAAEQKMPGPQFGTKVGRGVAVNSVPQPVQRGPAPKCPTKLQLRQFVAYRPMDQGLRERMRQGLEAFAREMKKKENEMKEAAIKDPRSQQERVKSGDLLAHILAQLDDDGAQTDESSQQAPTAAETSGPALTSTNPIRPLDIKGSGNAVDLYENSTAPSPLPPPPKPKNKYTDADWERARKEQEEAKACQDALLSHKVPPYFESDWGKAFLRAEAAVASGEPAPDMDALTRDLPQGRGPGVATAMSLPCTPSESPAAPSAQPGQVSSNSQPSDASESVSPMKAAGGSSRLGDQSTTPFTQQGLTVAASPSDIRPTNPTPGHATGQGTPTALRPTNPTPAHASQPHGTSRPVNPTPQGALSQSNGQSGGVNIPSETPSSHASFPAYPSTIPEHVEEGPLTGRSDFTGSMTPGKAGAQPQISDVPMESRHNVVPSVGSDIVLTKSLLVNVNGEPRQDTVRLPAAILGQKPGALPNDKFSELEDPVRRKVLTSSIAGSQMKGATNLSGMRGFELVPGEVNFGTLREGCTYAFTAHLKNVGVDSCRYKVKQPSPGTGLQVIYTPGPVAAGMKAKLDLVLYAIAVGVEGESGRGSIDHHLEITTETELLYLPVSADILTASEYDYRTHAGYQPKTVAGVRLLATRPPSREGIIRPRRDTSQQSQEVEEQSTR